MNVDANGLPLSEKEKALGMALAEMKHRMTAKLSMWSIAWWRPRHEPLWSFPVIASDEWWEEVMRKWVAFS